MRGSGVIAAVVVAAVALLTACSPGSSLSTNSATPTITASTSGAVPTAEGKVTPSAQSTAKGKATSKPVPVPVPPQGYTETVTAVGGAPEYDNLVGGYNGQVIAKGTPRFVFCFQGALYLLNLRDPVWAAWAKFNNGRFDNRLKLCSAYQLPAYSYR